MANIEDVFGGIKSRVDDNPLGASATSVTVQNEFTGLDVGVPGYLTIGDPQDALPGANGEVPTSEFVLYEGFTRNGDGTSTFSGLTRGLRNSTAQEWPQGTVIGVSIPGALLERLPTQKEDFSLGGNAVKDVSYLEADIISSPSVIGLEINWTDDTWQYIDRNGNPLGWTPDFTKLSPWNQIRRVNMAASGEITAYWGDDDYSHAPTDNSENVLVQFPPFWYDYQRTVEGGKDIQREWIANYNASGMTPWPTTQWGDTPYTYLGAYEACAYSPDGGTTWKLGSRSGETPVHGNGDYTGLNGNTLSNLDIKEARSYAQNIGANWQQQLIWGYAAHKILAKFYLGSMDFHSEIGRGIVDKDSGSGFAGEVTGYDSIDAQLSEANLGTATGTGSDGYTPVSILWVENPYGNLWMFVDGYEAVDSEYRILRRDGEWSVVGPDGWTSSDYEVSTASPLTDDDGYINDIEAEELLAILGIPAATAGSDSTYIPDYLWSHDSGENNILLSGGEWSRGSSAGLACLASNNDVTRSGRGYGARLSYIG